MTVFLTITLANSQAFEECKNIFINDDKIAHIWQATGDLDYVMQVEVATTDELQTLLADIRDLSSVKSCRANTMLHTVK